MDPHDTYCEAIVREYARGGEEIENETVFICVPSADFDSFLTSYQDDIRHLGFPRVAEVYRVFHAHNYDEADCNERCDGEPVFVWRCVEDGEEGGPYPASERKERRVSHHYEVVVYWYDVQDGAESCRHYLLGPAWHDAWLREFQEHVRRVPSHIATARVYTWRHEHEIGAPCNADCRLLRMWQRFTDGAERTERTYVGDAGGAEEKGREEEP